MVTNPFKLAVEAAAIAGQLAGITCAALLELIPRDEPARTLDDGHDFDEVAADAYLRGGAPDCGLGAAAAPYTVREYFAPGDLASVQLPDGPLITGVWDPSTVESGLLAFPAAYTTDSDRLDHLIALIEDVRNLLPTPADDEARPVRVPSAGAAPRDATIPSVDGDAGRPNVNWQLLASAQRAITHWLTGASCTQTAHWQSVADELRLVADELRDWQAQLYP